MANNYNQATLSPSSINLNPMHLAWLGMTGAECSKEKDGRYYVFWRECLNEDFEDDEIEGALEDGDIDQAQADFIRKSSFNEMLRHILYYNPDVTHLRVDSAWTCEKMRPGEFGGSACVVTRTQHLDMSTGSAYYNKDTGKLEMRWCEVRDFEPKESE